MFAVVLVVNDQGPVPDDKVCPSKSLIPVVACNEYPVSANSGELGTNVAVFASEETVIVPGSKIELDAPGVSSTVLDVTVIGSTGLLNTN